jgi:hypothetical protein
MSDELDFEMPDEDVFNAMLVDCHHMFHSLVMRHHKSINEMFVEPQLVDTSINAASLALLGLLLCYPLGNAVICRDISDRPAGRAAEKMIIETAHLAEGLKGVLIKPDPDGTLH